MKRAQAKKTIEDLDHYLVGGAVRDRLLGLTVTEHDHVVVGESPETMQLLGFRPVGKDFPVYLHPHTHEEWALARTEVKKGPGYKGFEVDASPDITLEDDLFRRDLTINAMAMTHDGQLIDPFGGQADLRGKVLRHVSKHFVEDPLRVLRVARFAARYHRLGFSIADSTMQIMKAIAASGELRYLAPERVWLEVRKALIGDAPEQFFIVLHRCGSLAELIPEFDRLFENRDAPAETETMLRFKRLSQQTAKLAIRFGFLAVSAMHKDAEFRIADSNLGSPQTPDSQAVAQLCKRLRVPAAICRFCVNLFKHLNDIAQLDQADAETIVTLVLALNGLRDARQFTDFTQACVLILAASGHPDIERLVNRLHRCKDAMRAIDAAGLAKTHTGSALVEKIRTSRIEAVRNIL